MRCLRKILLSGCIISIAVFGFGCESIHVLGGASGWADAGVIADTPGEAHPIADVDPCTVSRCRDWSVPVETPESGIVDSEISSDLDPNHGSALVCSGYVTSSGTVCVSCTTPAGTPPVVTCSETPPAAGSSSCHNIEVLGSRYLVCQGSDGKIESVTLADLTSCGSETVGDEICLVCIKAGQETFRQCRLASRNCSSERRAGKLCVVCKSVSGKVLSETCVADSMACKEEYDEGHPCLVCRDSAGKETNRVCAP